MPWKGPGKAALYMKHDRLANHVRRSTFLEPKLIDLQPELLLSDCLF